MRTSFGPILGLTLALLGTTSAFAEETDAPKALTVSGSATVVSDYRFRGISQTNKKPAVQGGLTLTHESGVYAGVWGSSVSEYIAAGSDQEIDLIGGFKKTVGGTTIDVGGIYYYYPGAEEIVPGYNSDFGEAYISVSHALGPVTGKLAVNYAPKQSALDYGLGKEDNLYAGLDLSAGIPETPVTLTGHVGRNFSKSFLSSGQKYTDWSIGASATFKAVTLGVSYVDTNKTFLSGIPGANRSIGKGGVVLSLGASF
jgi:uncharacterized protein (TIGR02001 family)